ncbi:hypothetical protein [Streptomyces lavendofoliae]|uniref:hypothetical protein n=1 Tax=Streptomyces lavendofoliae TaxID=67314 RepID=UPI003D8E2087
MIRTEIAVTVPRVDVDAVSDALFAIRPDAFSVGDMHRPGNLDMSEAATLTVSVAGDVREEAQQALEPFPSVRYTVKLTDVPR